MTAEQDIAAIADGGENTAEDVRRALTSVLARADAGTPIDVFIVAGQSNAEGRGDSTESPSVNSDSLEYTDSGLVALADPVGGADTGSAWPAFANAYVPIAGKLVCIVETAVGGSALYPDTSGSNWSPSGTLTADAISKAQAALAELESEGYLPTLRGVLWCQGESDAVNGVSQANYKAALINLHERFEASLGELGFYVFQIGAAADGSNAAQWAAIREAQREACAETLRMELVFTGAVDFPARGMMSDNIHYTQAGYNEMGAVGGHVVASGAAAASFLTLKDTPTSYDGHGGKLLVVNDREDGVEFGAAVELGTLRGTASIDNPDTEVDVTHGIGSTPNPGEIQVSPANQDAAESDWWLSDFGATTFRINVASTPTTSAKWHWLYVPATEADPPEYWEEVLEDEPLFYYRLEETAGPTVEDSTGGGNDGTVVGADLDVPGKIGSAVSFDGADDYLEAIALGDLTALTIEFWAKIPNGAGGGSGVTHLCGVTDASSSNIVHIAVNSNGTIVIGERTGSSTLSEVTSANAWDDDQWHHFVATFQAGGAKELWVDGTKDATGSAQSGTWNLSATTFMFGAWNNRGNAVIWHVACYQDEIAVYDKVLPAARIIAHFNAAG